jgi:hypothetical protein
MAVPVSLPMRLVAELPMAWRHHCGHLNDGYFREGDMCSGCNTDVKPGQVEARYLLVGMEGS